ncbi:MAG: hypothetical protein ACTSYB_12460 [Candidatus Helarchaeota archaeon]
MQISFIEIAVLLITILFIVLLVLFVVQSIRHHRTSAPLLLSLFLGFLAGVVTILGELLSVSVIMNYSLLALQLNLYGFQFFFFYIFLERLISEKINTKRYVLVVSILLIQTFSLWATVIFLDWTEVTQIFWFFADTAYMILGLLVFFGFGFVIYFKTYLFTRETKPIIFSIAMLIISIGFIFLGVKDCLDFFDISIPFVGYAVALGNAFFVVGLIIFTITYVFDIDYIYRLPHNVYLLMVLTRAGIPLHIVKFKTKRNIDHESDLLSGLISAINNVFEEVFRTTASIRKISSDDIHLLMESGEKVVCVLITDNLSFFLTRALKRYTKIFEQEFQLELEENIQDSVVYNKAVELIKPIFPFFKVDKVL